MPRDGDERRRRVKRKRGKWLAGLVAVVALVAAAHTAVWYWAMGAMERQVAATLAAGPWPGWRAGGGRLQRDGWPLRVTVHVPDPSLEGPRPVGVAGGAPALRWTAGRLSASVSLLRPRLLVLTVAGEQGLAIGRAPPVPVTARLIRAEVPLEPGVPSHRIAVTVDSLRASLAQGPLTLDHLALKAEARPAALQGEPALAVDLRAEGVALPPGPAWPLGPTIRHLGLDAAITGPVPRTPDLLARAQGWRDGGGVLEVRRLEVDWDQTRLDASGTIALDAGLQPMGAAKARVIGHEAALRALAAAGVLTPRGAAAAGAVLALMARPAPEDGRPMVEVPLSLQDRTLALGRIPLVRLPELVWRPPS